MVAVTVTWMRKPFQVEVDTAQPLVVFKMQLFSLTGVPPERQKIMLAKGGLLKDDADWAKVGLKAGQKLMMLGTADKVPEAPAAAPVFMEDLPEDEQDLNGFAKYGAGLQNLGNTCYMNSTLQCLYRVPELRQALNTYNYQDPRLSLPHDLVIAARGLFKELERSAAPVMPYTFLSRLRAVYPQFAEQNRIGAYKQQDAEECWSQLVYALNTQLQGDATANDAVVKRLFGVGLHTELKSAETGEVRVEDSVAYELKCNITSEVNELAEGVTLGLKEDRELTSSATGQNTVFAGSSKISSLPTYLTMQLVRFFYKVEVQQKAKIMRKVNFPMVLDMYSFCTPELQKELAVGRKILQEADEAKDQAERVARDARRKELEAKEAASKPGMKKVAKKTHSGTASSATAAKVEEEKKKEEPATAAPEQAAASEEKGDVEMAEAEPSSAAEGEAKEATEPARKPSLTGRYELVAVLTHKGRSADSGHYVSWVKQDDGAWIQFDDEELILRKEAEIATLSGGGDWHMAYLLLYKAILA